MTGEEWIKISEKLKTLGNKPMRMYKCCRCGFVGSKTFIKSVKLRLTGKVVKQCRYGCKEL